MNCKTSHKIMINYSSENLESSKFREFKTHLNKCESCSSIYAEIETTFNLIESREILQDNPFLYYKINNKLENRIQKRIFPEFNRVLQPALFSLVLVIPIVVGIKFGNIYKKPSSKILEENLIEYYFNDFKQETIEVLLLDE